VVCNVFVGMRKGKEGGKLSSSASRLFLHGGKKKKCKKFSPRPTKKRGKNGSLWSPGYPETRRVGGKRRQFPLPPLPCFFSETWRGKKRKGGGGFSSKQVYGGEKKSVSGAVLWLALEKGGREKKEEERANKLPEILSGGEKWERHLPSVLKLEGERGKSPLPCITAEGVGKVWASHRPVAHHSEEKWRDTRVEEKKKPGVKKGRSPSIWPPLPSFLKVPQEKGKEKQQKGLIKPAPVFAPTRKILGGLSPLCHGTGGERGKKFPNNSAWPLRN